MEHRIYQEFCSIAYNEAGISIKEGKESLVEARVGKRLRALDLSNEKEYLKYLQKDASGEEMVCFLDAITTNFTNFMREPDHFDALTRIVTQRQNSRRPFRLWCAAASSGEEPYTLAITLLEALRDQITDFKILATDISTMALKKAIAGRYEERQIEPLTANQRTRYLHKVDCKNAIYEVRPEVKQQIAFRRLNLATPPFPMTGPMDVVFCRNVMIYFDHTVRQGLVSEIERLLIPGGILFIGHSETLSGINSRLTAIRPSVYRKPLED